MLYPAQAGTLIHLKNTDVRVRQQLMEQGLLSNGYHAQMEKVHLANAEQLRGIITQIGWPTHDKVGDEASQAAWLIAQHAISLPNFMRQCLTLLDQEAQAGQVDPTNWAFLADRIAMYEGRSQRFGTQFINDESGTLIPYQLDGSVAIVDQRRQALGMNTVQERLRELTHEPNRQHPTDYKEQQANYEAWRRRVGWIA